MEENKTPQEGTESQEIKYATPMQRLWAWVGVVYMVILVLLSTYALSHGSYMKGIGGIMLAPGLCGLGASAILRYRQGVGKGGVTACALIAGAAFLLAVAGVIRAVPNLMGQL